MYSSRTGIQTAFGHVVLGKKKKDVSRAWYESGNRTFIPLSKSHKKIAKQWHPTLNGELTAADVTADSGKKVWWRCKKGADHVWQTSVGLRTRGSQCPFCSKVRVSQDNNLKELFPDIAAQLHPTKNGVLKAQDIAPSSGIKVWWVCAKGHRWEQSILKRVKSKIICWECSGQTSPGPIAKPKAKRS